MAGHRSTLKKDHKRFKSKHASKGSLKELNKGRIEKPGGGRKPKVSDNVKRDRRNKLRQLKENKVKVVENTRRIFEGRHGVARVVAVIPLCQDCDTSNVVALLNKAVDLDSVIVPPEGVVQVAVPRFKQKLRYILPPRNLLATLEAAKVADFVVFSLSAHTEVDAFGELCIRAIEAQGVSNVFATIEGLLDVDGSKTQGDVRRSLTMFFSHFFPTTDKLYSPDAPSEALNLIRAISQKQPSGIRWRDSRPYIVTEQVDYDTESGCIVVEGVVRGNVGLNPDRLVHLPGCGDFQLHKVLLEQGGEVVPSDQQEIKVTILGRSVDEEEEIALQEERIQKQTAVMMDVDSGWDIANDDNDEEETTKVKKRKIPEGMSEYQASWIVDSDSEEEDDEGDLEDAGLLDDDIGDMDEAGQLDSEGEMEVDEQGDEQDDDQDDDQYDAELDDIEEQRQLVDFRARAQEDLEFPDEIELPPTDNARDRLRRYRGVKNLRRSFWDVDEMDAHTPIGWKQLTRISNYRATRNRIHNESAAEAQIAPGTRVRVYIRASADILATSGPLYAVYGLLHHEHEPAVLNMSITINSEFEDPIETQDELMVQCGPRRMIINPLFSPAGNNAANKVYRSHQFIHPGQTAMATVIGPVVLGNEPVVYFKRNSEGIFTLVGSGTVVDVDHQRILCRRVIITGHPLKIHKRVVTIRYMFFNQHDVHWFKSVPLFTKHGKTGYIQESLGTHGYFKATFDGHIGPQDTVGMALYKRVWPKVARDFVEI